MTRGQEGPTCLRKKVWGHLTLSGGFHVCMSGLAFPSEETESAEVVGPQPSLRCAVEEAHVAGRK